jgi:DNA ligase-1
MEFADFAARADAIEAEDADLATVDRVAGLFEAAGDDLDRLARFVQGRVVAAHDTTTLDIGPTLCHEALAKAAGRNVTADDVEAVLADVGEIGVVAERLDLAGQRGLAAFGAGDVADDGGLTVEAVAADLRAIAAASGPGSTDTKLDTLFGLFNRAEPLGARYLARLVLGEMRIGVGEGTVRDAVAQAFDVPTEAVERAIQASNDCGLVAETAREDGADGLADIGLAVGRPVRAMLAQTGAAEDAIGAWGCAGVETKFDGARVQVHHDGEETTVFSRNLEDVTDSLPEVVEFVDDRLASPAILDGEVVAVDADGDPLPFQAVLRRFRRKHDVAAAREDVAVEFTAFDCLHADGDDLLEDPFLGRHERLTALLEDGVADLIVTDDVEEIADRESAALSAGHEGIMLKNPESAYTPGARGRDWLKRKPDVETLDLVVTGAEWGEGRRATLMGTFQVAARTDDGFAPVGKVATGITDAELEELDALLEPHVESESGTELDIEPAVVLEVGYEEIQRSPSYDAGYALRFPRFLAVRSDMDPSRADDLGRIERLVDGG